MIDVSCIIINYNSSKFTIPCIDSIISNNNTNSLSYELVIVDNASNYNDYTVLKQYIEILKLDNIKLVRSKINVGFGAGNMIGVQNSLPCSYYAFINNDTLQVNANCLLRLKEFMVKTPDAGICSPQMLDEHKNFRVTIDHFSSLQREIFKRSLLEFVAPKIYLNRKKKYKTPTRVHYVQGSFMFTDSETFNQVGGFDTNIFLYYEETDLSRRFLKQQKKNTYLVPELEYIHYKSASIVRNIDIKIEQKISLLYNIEKQYGWLHRKILLLYFIIRYFFSSIFKPKYWKLFFILLAGAPLSKSLKNKQKIVSP